MLTSFTNSRWLLLALPLVAIVSGCCCESFPLAGECTCPTDARRIYCGAGEEAVRRCPCGPDHEFYGHKPTEWRTWPDGWRCGQYPCSAHTAPLLPEQPVSAVPSEADPTRLNPFRDMGTAEELPPESAGPGFAPAPQIPPQSSARNSAPLRTPQPVNTLPAEPLPKDLPLQNQGSVNPSSGSMPSSAMLFPKLIPAEETDVGTEISDDSEPMESAETQAELAPATTQASASSARPQEDNISTDVGDQAAANRIVEHLAHNLSN